MTAQNQTNSQMAVDRCIVRHLAGSHAYGMSLPTSDVDYRGIFVADRKYIETPFFNVETVDIQGEEDTTYHELSKFMLLTANQNPNIVETLWVHEDDVCFSTSAYQLLRSNRQRLLTTGIASAYSGYAYSQLKRLTDHHKWLTIMDEGKQQIASIWRQELLTTQQLRNHFEGEMLDAIGVPFIETVPLEQVEYEWMDVVKVLLPESRLMCNIPIMPYESYDFDLDTLNQDVIAVKLPANVPGVILYQSIGSRALSRQGMFILNHNVNVENLQQLVTIYANTQLNDANQKKWSNYHTWRQNRNIARSKLEAEHGYDTKHASHLVRLLKTGIEAMETGIVNVRRPDAKELLDIRHGSLTLKELVEYSDMLYETLDKVKASSPLPNSINRDFIAQLTLDVRDEYSATRKRA